MTTPITVLLAAAGTLLLHFGWELIQAPAFSSFASPPAGMLLHCFRAALGDLAIAAGSYVATAGVFRHWDWMRRDRWRGPAALWMATGLAVTIVFERWALSTGRWEYGPEMPVVFGIGFWPLLQWVVIPALTVALLRGLCAALVGRCPPRH